MGLVELVKASSNGFDGILIDSIFDVGVDVARESVAKVIAGCFYPAVTQALLLTNGTGFSIVHVVFEQRKEPSSPRGNTSTTQVSNSGALSRWV